METLEMLAKSVLFVLAFSTIGYELVKERKNLNFIWKIWKRFSLKIFIEVLGVLFMVLASATVCIQVPGFEYLKFGLSNLFYENGGNVLITPVLDELKSTNSIRYSVVIFFAMCVVAAPFLSRSEENIFRRGHHSRKEIIKKSIEFGFVHCLVGIPLYAGFILSFVGLYFAYKYKKAYERCKVNMGDGYKEGHLYKRLFEIIKERNIKETEIANLEELIKMSKEDFAMDEGVIESTTYHTMYNTIIFFGLLVFSINTIL